MGADYHEIQKLKGADNYQRWEVAIRTTLIVNRLFKVVKPDYIPPPVPTSNASETLKLIEEYDTYKDLDEQALAAIQMTCESGLYQQIKSASTAQQAWAKLKE